MITSETFLTKHERHVIRAALHRYVTVRAKEGKINATAKGRFAADADCYVANDLIRQLGSL